MMGPINQFVVTSCNITRWRHQMETSSALLALYAGNSPVIGEFPAQRSVTRSFDVSLLCNWKNIWVNNGNAGDLRRQRAHYDVTVTIPLIQNDDCYTLPASGPCKEAVKVPIRMVAHKTHEQLQWRHNERDGVSNHQPHECLLNRLFGHRWKKTSKLRVICLWWEFTGDRWIPHTKGQ